MLVLGEALTPREWIGIGLMLVAIVLTESKELFVKKLPAVKEEKQ